MDEVLQPSQHIRIMSNQSVYLTTLFSGLASSLSGLPVSVSILLPETDNCPSWLSWRERMTVKNISWSISMTKCCLTQKGSNSWPPDHIRCASDWAAKASMKMITKTHTHTHTHTTHTHTHTHTNTYLRHFLQQKNIGCFLISAKNICWGYSLEVPQQGASNEYPQYIFVEI